MRRPAVLALLAIVAAMLVAGCGGESTTADPEPPPPTTAPPAPPPPPAKPSPTFTKADIARIALAPPNAPPGLRFAQEDSGPISLADAEFELPPPTLRQLRALGLLTMHDSIFVSRQPGTDQRVSQRIWLFKNRGGATAWLQKTKDDAIQLQWSEVASPMLGDESWAAGGLIQVGGGQGITHAFRLGNTVQTIFMYGDVTPPNEAGALAAAQAALAKARKG
jgi:hypothetical protein